MTTQNLRGAERQADGTRCEEDKNENELSDWQHVPEVTLEVVIKVGGLTLPLTAADLAGPLHAGPVDGNLTEE